MEAMNKNWAIKLYNFHPNNDKLGDDHAFNVEKHMLAKSLLLT